MQAVKVAIPGKFYDSQIYNGRLYLWRIDGSFITVDWDKLVDQITISEELKIVLKFSLRFSDELYGNSLLQDAEVRRLMQSKFKRLSESVIKIKNETLSLCTISEQDNPFPFPHADSTIHYQTIYVGSQSGVSASGCKTAQRNGTLDTTEKLLDLPVLSLSASHLNLALAAGDEGLFDYSLFQNSIDKYRDPRPLSNNHCNLTRWLYPSIFGSSYFNNGYFADFKTKRKTETVKKDELVQLEGKRSSSLASGLSEAGENQNKITQYERKFQSLVSSENIFEQDSFEFDNIGSIEDGVRFTWGIQDKLCSIARNSIKIAQYSPGSRAKSTTGKFKNLGCIPINDLRGEVISADSSLFGIILEQEDGLLVVGSSLESHFFQGEPVNWRVFPKSKNYSTHLHIVYDDEIHIYAFTDDYFVDQSTKKLGIGVSVGQTL
jgi:hypothetical protein